MDLCPTTMEGGQGRNSEEENQGAALKTGCFQKRTSALPRQTDFMGQEGEIVKMAYDALLAVAFPDNEQKYKPPPQTPVKKRSLANAGFERLGSAPNRFAWFSILPWSQGPENRWVGTTHGPRVMFFNPWCWETGFLRCVCAPEIFQTAGRWITAHQMHVRFTSSFQAQLCKAKRVFKCPLPS